MRSSTGRWVSGDDFFNRTDELEQMEQLVRDGNHVLLTGQRRVGKTSLTRALGERLRSRGWTCLFTDVEGAVSEEDAIAEMAKAVYPVQPIGKHLVGSLGRRLDRTFGKLEEVGAHEFRLKFRAVLNQGTWRRRGADLIKFCALHDKRILLVVDELPIFLTRLLRCEEDDGRRRVDVFLSWLRKAFQASEGPSPVLLATGSIGLVPLVGRLGLPDRINYLHEVRLGPWGRADSEECFRRLAGHYCISLEEGVAGAVYDRLGIGVPQHMQSFFARLRRSPEVGRTGEIGVEDVERVYEKEMLGPVGQVDLLHYDTRLEDALGDDLDYEIARRILGETATQGKLSPAARTALERAYAGSVERASDVAMIIDILVHDGYLERHGDDYRFCSRWLKDWWSLRAKGRAVPLESLHVDVPGDRRIGF